MLPSASAPTLVLAASLLLAACDTGTGAYLRAPDQPEDPASTPPAAFSAGPLQAVAVAVSSAKTPGVDPRVFRDARKSSLLPRPASLLIAEIQGLETLFRATDLKSPDRPHILRRLAEDYHELACVNSTGMAGTQNATARKAREETIRNYTLLVADYSGVPSPDFPTSSPPAYPLLDDVDYFLGYEYEQSGDAANARRAYYDLIQKMPGSKYIPAAYLAFGDMFFDEAQSDPTKWEIAKQAYQKTIAYPPPDNRVYGYAWYRLAHVFGNLSESPQALNAFKKTIDFATLFPRLPGSDALAEAARDDIIPVYALAGDPNAAYDFFHNLAGDVPGANDRAFGMMDALGVAYFHAGHFPEAAALYKDLDARDPAGDRACYESRIAQAKSVAASPTASPCRAR
jgi:tetratricopeptide (TPR) repeat protein